MVHLVNLPYDLDSLQGYFSSAADVAQYLKDCGCDGAEIIYGERGAPSLIPPRLVGGYHLMFYAAWMDFWREDTDALNREFGSAETWQEFYQGKRRMDLVRQLSRDLDRAQYMGVPYVVFHVSEVTPEECYTYRWRYTDAEVVEAAAELINILLDGRGYTFEFLMENLPWSGLRFDDPELTRLLLDRVHYPKKGLLLDTGHLMSTNPTLRDDAEALRYVHRCLDEHGELCRYIRGVHLHKSLSGAYVQTHCGKPVSLPSDYYERFRVSYAHVLQIDRHEALDTPQVRDLIDRIQPAYLTHEVNAADWMEKCEGVRRQRQWFR